MKGVSSGNAYGINEEASNDNRYQPGGAICAPIAYFLLSLLPYIGLRQPLAIFFRRSLLMSHSMLRTGTIH